MSKEKKQVKKEPYQISIYEMQALLFWAAVGVANSGGGSYEDDIENIISKHAHDISKFYKFALPAKPRLKNNDPDQALAEIK